MISKKELEEMRIGIADACGVDPSEISDEYIIDVVTFEEAQEQ